MNLKQKFSVPINPKMDKEFIENEFIPFLKRNRDNIEDLYFTVRMSPFNQDAMGTIIEKDEVSTLIANAFIISNEVGIPLSATFNNKFISPNYQNFKLFLKNFSLLYQAGIRIATIPFTSWVLFPELKKEFPELFIKNTVLQKVREPNEVFKLFESGFDYINLDRDLMRNQERLKEIDEARKTAEKKLDKKLFLSILFNESCIGNCPIQEEHFLYNIHNNKETQSNTFFHSEMNSISCSQWEKQDKVYPLKQANIIIDEEFLNGLGMIDVFKMHGRESLNVLKNTMYIIDGLREDKKILDNFEYFKLENKIQQEKYNEWVKFTKNCKFDCWKCNKCEELLEKK